MNYKVETIEGIGPAYADRLATANIRTAGDLLELCCRPKGRQEVARVTGISESVLLKWANMADLMRISGIGRQFAELLEATGVDTVKELRNRNPDNLAAKLREVNDERHLSRTSPAISLVENWIHQAQSLPPKMSY